MFFKIELFKWNKKCAKAKRVVNILKDIYDQLSRGKPLHWNYEKDTVESFKSFFSLITLKKA